MPSAPLLPAAVFENLVRLVDVELPLGVLRDELRRAVDEIAGRGSGAAVDVILHRPLVDQQRERLPYRLVGQRRMLGLHARTLAVDLGPRIGRVELDVLDIAAVRHVGLALAALFQPQQDLVLDLQVPGVVVFAGLQHGACRRDRVAAALHLDGVEVRPVRHVVVRIEFAAHHVARLEVDEPVRAGADRLEVRRRVAGFCARVVGVEVFRNDHAAHADEGVGPERRRLVEQDAHRVASRPSRPSRPCSCRWWSRPFPGPWRIPS